MPFQNVYLPSTNDILIRRVNLAENSLIGCWRMLFVEWEISVLDEFYARIGLQLESF